MFGESCRFSHPPELIDPSLLVSPPSSASSIAEGRRQMFPRVKAENEQKRKESQTHKINNKLLNRNKEGAFRRWLLDIFGLEKLQSGSGIIDVAGGKGVLSFELSNLNGINCTVIDPRPLNLRHYKKRLLVGMFHRTEVLQCYNNKPMPKDEKEIVLPNHIRIFMDEALINSLSSQNTNNTNNNTNTEEREEEEENFPTKKEGKEFYKEAMEKGRSVCWSKKGLVDHNTVEEKWKYDRHDNNNNNNNNDNNNNMNMNNNEKNSNINGERDNNSDEQAEIFAAEIEEEEIKSDSREITKWEEAKEVFKNCSVVLGLHPDQATEAIVDFALKWDKPFAVLPCCVYHKEFPKRRFPDGSPISRYEDFVQYLIAKDPENIRQALLDIEGKNIILYKTQNTTIEER